METLNDVLRNVDKLIYDYCNDSWTCALFLSECLLLHNTVQTFPNLPTETIDVFSYCKGGNNSKLFSKDWYIRFDPAFYPVPTNLDLSFVKDSSGSKLVTLILDKIQNEKECYFVSHGGTQKHSRYLRCYRSRSHNRNIEDTKCSFVKATLRKTRKDGTNIDVEAAAMNCRSNKENVLSTNGKISRRTTSLRPSITSDLCQAHLTVRVDKISYYIQCQNGNCVHNKHPKVDKCISNTTGMRYIPNECKEEIKNLASYHAPRGSAILMGLLEYGIELTRSQIANIVGFPKLAEVVGDDLEIEKKSNMSDVDNLVKCLEDKGAFYMGLYHREDVASKELIGGNRKKHAKTDDKNTLKKGMSKADGKNTGKKGTSTRMSISTYDVFKCKSSSY
jgi:hypothetical protein